MLELSQQLIQVALLWNIDSYSSAFDQIAKSQRYSQKALFRIGLWPIVSSSEPEIGMGIGLVLASLLEQWSSVRVYRIMAEVTNSPSANYEWSIDKSQFGVDDWEVEGLDENVAIWGVFEIIGEHIHFSVEVENDAREDDDVFKLDYKEISLVALINSLPAIAESIITWIDPTKADRAGDHYTHVSDIDNSLLEEFLRRIFDWEREYFLSLSGHKNELPIPQEYLNSLVHLSQRMQSDFGAWMLALCISRSILFNDTPWNESLVPRVREIVETLGNYPVLVSVLCTTLFRLHYGPEVFDILEGNILEYPANSVVWNTLAAIYGALREDLAAIDVFQRAIEAKSALVSTYRNYADLMILLNNQQIQLKVGNQHTSPAGRPFIERYLFADLEQSSPNLREAASAYRIAFEQNPEEIDALMQLVTCLIALHDPNLWEYCQKLVERDVEGGITATIIDQLSEEDIPFFIEMLQKILFNTSKPMNVRINLVRCYLAIEEYDKANDELALISNKDLSPQNQLLLPRLSLTAQIAEFDSRVTEINDIIDSNGKISDSDIEFLEMLIEKEPLFSEGYALLAKSYLGRNEQDAALEVLLDCQNAAPFNPEVTALLAKVLWDEDETDLAFSCLENGLKEDRHNATLLSLKGRFLFDNGQDEDAKESLLQAEESDPTNAELSVTRRYIANTLITSNKE